jgi:hypothetical protein
MSSQPSYLYGIVQAEGPKEFGAIGLGGSLVRTVCEGGIGIVAGESERLAFSRIAPERTLQCLAQHQRVLEQVMRDSPVIPLKFGTYADDEGQIRRILRQGAGEFAAALKEFGPKVEVDLSACWTDLAGVLAEIAGDAAIAAAKARLADRPASTQQRAEVGQLVKKLLDERRDQVASRLEAALRAVCAKVIVNPAKDDTTILNAAVLIGREEQARLEGVLDQLDHSHAGRLHIRCIGPLPAYSFAMAEIQALDADELDAARQALQLGETASFAQIKAAHRRLLAELHPDRNADTRTACRLQDVSDAYRILEDYALHFRHTLGGEGGAVIVKVRSLDDLRAASRTPARAARATSLQCAEVEAA